VKDLVFLPYKNAPTKTSSTNLASSRDAADNSRNPIILSPTPLATRQPQKTAGLVTPQPLKASRSRPRSNIEPTVNLADEVTSALRRPIPCKSGGFNPLLIPNSTKCGFSSQNQEECDDEYETTPPSLSMVLRSGRQDPFRQYPIPSLGTYVDELMDYG
jgi:hypothetical protein